MMKQIYLALILSLTFLYSSSQQTKQDVISPGGGYSSNSLYSLQWTLGETVATTFVSDHSIYTQGFNQTFFVLKKGSSAENKELVKVLAAPNPVTTSLNLSVESLTAMGYSVVMSDLHGVRVYQKHTNVSNQNLSIDMRRFASGVYLIQVFDKNNLVVNTLKVVKL